MYQEILKVKELLGLNNVLPPERIPPGDKAFLTVAKNLDIDDSRKGTIRGGYANPVYRGSGIHSFFNYLDVGLFIERSDLKRLKPDYTSEIVRSGVGSARMNYVGVQDRIYYTNNSIIEYYDTQKKEPVAFEEATQTYKIKMLPGHLIEWFQGRLYVARGGELWASDPMAPHQTDTRRGFKQLGGYLTMIRAVQDGLYVSNGDKTFWLAGEFTEMSRKNADEDPAIMGSDVRVDGGFVGGRGFPSWVIVWMTRTGVVVGPPGGEVILVNKNFRPELENLGAAMVRKIVKSPKQQFYQYVIGQKISPDITLNMSGSKFLTTTSMTGSIA